MKNFTKLIFVLLFISSLRSVFSGPVQTSYLWHLQQPIYWPAYDPNNDKTYQTAYVSIQNQGNQGNHPQTDVTSVFSKADRQQIYQFRMKDAIDSINSHPDAGAQCTFPGDLIENINSLGQNNACGYSSNWADTYKQLFSQQKTSGGFPRVDEVFFTYHHAFAPLISGNMLLKELEIQKVISQNTWGKSASKGMFPAEMAFSERIIPWIKKAGVEWVIVPNNHISRCIENYKFSPSGDNNDPPNKADQTNPSQDNWFSSQINRGCNPNNAAPYSYRPHYAQYVDPDTAEVSKIIVVPAAMAMSWKDSESCYSTGDIQQIADHNEDDHPMLILLAHDGDNAFSGGYTYYTNCVSNFVNDAVGKGYNPTTIQQYLNDYPVDENDIVHVSDGAWVNHDSDFGDPQFIWGWNGVLMGDNGFDILGWECRSHQWAVIAASQNWVDTAEQIQGQLDISQVQNPTSSATPAEVAWHLHLAQPSGWLYYGCPIQDMQDKPIISANQAISWAQKVVKSGDPSDKTGPSISYVNRYPYNPGAYGAGSLYNYKYTRVPNDFHIWTFAYDLSGISSVTLKYRTSSSEKPELANKVRNPEKHGIPSTASSWNSKTMNYRKFPKDHSGANFDFLPNYIADQYWIYMTGFSNTLMDYYIEAVDNLGNVAKSDIYHVWIDNNPGNDFRVVEDY
ncbi:alpha-amylase-related [Anaeramoeba flamelloides]|uniref:Alpha-amylase-related n=1 Tax=Anaeramoeba flamelloides TaxID=1746091 RepID=A0AAV7ZDU0_9EUKA|nr:alpha-amylase-related [Anaeramoeba flamelloides]KAJ6231874.1 alpha-amylase-related [Anaeramoeba flamelloides]